MLVLSRKVGERIIIDENIEIEILQISGSRIRIGIKAPKDVRIRRSELIVEDSSLVIADPSST